MAQGVGSPRSPSSPSAAPAVVRPHRFASVSTIVASQPSRDRTISHGASKTSGQSVNNSASISNASTASATPVTAPLTAPMVSPLPSSVPSSNPAPVSPSVSGTLRRSSSTSSNASRKPSYNPETLPNGILSGDLYLSSPQIPLPGWLSVECSLIGSELRWLCKEPMCYSAIELSSLIKCSKLKAGSIDAISTAGGLNQIQSTDPSIPSDPSIQSIPSNPSHSSDTSDPSSESIPGSTIHHNTLSSSSSSSSHPVTAAFSLQTPTDDTYILGFSTLEGAALWRDAVEFHAPHLKKAPVSARGSGSSYGSSTSSSSAMASLSNPSLATSVTAPSGVGLPNHGLAGHHDPSEESSQAGGVSLVSGSAGVVGVVPQQGSALSILVGSLPPPPSSLKSSSSGRLSGDVSVEGVSSLSPVPSLSSLVSGLTLPTAISSPSFQSKSGRPVSSDRSQSVSEGKLSRRDSKDVPSSPSSSSLEKAEKENNSDSVAALSLIKFRLGENAPWVSASAFNLIRLFFHGKYKFIKAIFAVIPATEADKVAGALARMFFYADIPLALVKSVIDWEVERTTVVNQLFRQDSIASKIMTAYTRIIAQPYLVATLKTHVAKIVKCGSELEINPEQLKDAEEREAVGARVFQVQQIITDLLNTIRESSPSVPTECRLICSFLDSAVGGKFGDSKATEISLAGYLFLRLINPAIVVPDSLGIIDKNSLTPEGRRSLLLVSKVVLNMANQVPFSKEPHLIPFNSFLNEKLPLIQSFIADCVQVNPDAALTTTDLPAPLLILDELSLLYKLLYPLQEKLASALAPEANVLKRFRAAFSALGPPLPTSTTGPNSNTPSTSDAKKDKKDKKKSDPNDTPPCPLPPSLMHFASKSYMANHA